MAVVEPIQKPIKAHQYVTDSILKALFRKNRRKRPISANRKTIKLLHRNPLLKYQILTKTVSIDCSEPVLIFRQSQLRTAAEM